MRNSSSVDFSILFRLSVASAFVFSSCAPIGPNHEVPEIPLPDHWNSEVRKDLNSSSPQIENWWRKFNDPKLNELIQTASKGNRTLSIAAERINEASSLSEISKAGLKPMVGAAGSVSRDRISESVLPLPGPVPNNPFTFYSAGTAAGWELDFVGGVRRAAEAAKANQEATEEFYRDTMVIVFAETASSYVDCRTLQQRISIANKNIAYQKESLRITKERNRIGLAPDLDVSLAETNLARSQALIPLLQSLLAASQNRLGVVCGKYPGSVDSMLGSGSIPSPSRSSSIGVPADLVRSRPDIRAAERLLAAQSALVGVAKAELFPKFTLSGSLALQAGSSGDLLDSQSRAYGFGPSFRWRIFEGGRIKESIKLEESRSRQAYTNYERVILQSMAEVETAMSAIANERDRYNRLDQSVKAARKSVALVRDSYQSGLVDFQVVLEADRSLFLLDDELAVSRGQTARNHIALYRSLGGGTRIDPPSK